MKIVLGFVLSAALGVALGIGFAVWHLGMPESAVASAVPVVEGDQPRAVVEEELHHFGPVEALSEQSHRFRITNEGSAPLRLKTNPEDSSCRCTVGSIEKNVVMPGDSTFVTVKWHGKGHVYRFRETATVRTNDPRRPRIELMVSGRAVRMVTPMPQELMTTTAPGQEVVAAVRLYAYRRDVPLKIEQLQLSNASVASYFELEELPLSTEDLAKEEAQSGVRLQVRLKPGLPPGAIRQTIRVVHNLAEEPLEVPIHVEVVQDLTFAGTGWDKQKQVLHLGEIGPQGITRGLDLFVRGDYRRNFELKLQSVEPDFMQVEIGDPVDLGDRMTRVSLKVIVPPEGSRVNDAETSSEMGKVVLTSTHPREKQLEFQVQFSLKQPE